MGLESLRLPTQRSATGVLGPFPLCGPHYAVDHGSPDWLLSVPLRLFKDVGKSKPYLIFTG
jgi:hypothetical protein